eukprot:4051589-Pyramimonas_sp.AAC.1
MNTIGKRMNTIGKRMNTIGKRAHTCSVPDRCGGGAARVRRSSRCGTAPACSPCRGRRKGPGAVESGWMSPK